MTTSELRSFPPVNRTRSIGLSKSIGKTFKRRSIAGLNNVGLVVALIGEKTYEFGCWLGKVGEEKQAEPEELFEEVPDFGPMPDFPSIRK